MLNNTPSQLREILEDLVMGTLGKRQPKFTETGSLSDYEQAIKTAVLEIIGETEKYPEMPANSGMYNPEMVTRNRLRAEQRKSLSMLMGEQL